MNDIDNSLAAAGRGSQAETTFGVAAALLRTARGPGPCGRRRGLARARCLAAAPLWPRPRPQAATAQAPAPALGMPVPHARRPLPRRLSPSACSPVRCRFPGPRFPPGLPQRPCIVGRPAARSTGPAPFRPPPVGGLESGNRRANPAGKSGGRNQGWKPEHKHGGRNPMPGPQDTARADPSASHRRARGSDRTAT